MDTLPCKRDGEHTSRIRLQVVNPTLHVEIYQSPVRIPQTLASRKLKLIASIMSPNQITLPSLVTNLRLMINALLPRPQHITVVIFKSCTKSCACLAGCIQRSRHSGLDYETTLTPKPSTLIAPSLKTSVCGVSSAYALGCEPGASHGS